MDNSNKQNELNLSKKQNITTSVEVIIFDLDKTLINETICKETETVLQKLKERQYSLAVASYNAYAKWFCDRYNISKYFDIICANPAETKISHIKSIMQFYNITDTSKMVFFDDKYSNCHIIQSELQIPSIKVDKQCGIRLCDIMWLL